MALALLVAGLVLPVLVFWLLTSRGRSTGALAAGIAVAIGWAINIAWASVAHESVPIAARFGWACPAVLVLLTWLALRFTRRRAA